MIEQGFYSLVAVRLDNTGQYKRITRRQKTLIHTQPQKRIGQSPLRVHLRDQADHGQRLDNRLRPSQAKPRGTKTRNRRLTHNHVRIRGGQELE